LERERLLEVVTGRIQQRLDALELPVQDTKGQTAGWYGVAPYLLDGALGLEDLGLHGSGEGADGEDETINRFRDHVDFALAPDWEVLAPRRRISPQCSPRWRSPRPGCARCAPW